MDGRITCADYIRRQASLVNTYVVGPCMWSSFFSTLAPHLNRTKRTFRQASQVAIPCSNLFTMDLLTKPFEDHDDFTRRRGAPRITSPPAVDSPLAYNEDEIVGIFTDIYKHFISIFYIKEELVAFPPEDTGRHVLDRRYLSEELFLSDRVISLMERLPYVDKTEDNIHKRDSIEWYPQSIMADFRNTKRARYLRDPGGLSWVDPNSDYSDRDGPDLHFMRPTDIALGDPMTFGAQQVILDTEASMWAPLAAVRCF